MLVRSNRLATRSCLAGLLGLATIVIPSVVQAGNDDIAAPHTFQGKYLQRIATYPDGHTETTHHLVDDREIGVQIDVGPDAFPDLEYGAVIRVRGTRKAGGKFSVKNLELLQPAPQPRQPLVNPTPRTPRTLALINIQWSSGGDDMTVEELNQRVFTNEDSTAAFYHEVSYGMETLTGAAFGPYTMPQPSSCDYQQIASDAQAAMAAAGHDTSQYEQFMYYFPRLSSCGWSGLASVGAPDRAAEGSWYNGSAGCVVLAQEVGHNYGMIHSHTYQCSSGQPYDGNCSSNEYGNRYDPMGGGCGHMNVVQKGYMNWLSNCNFVTATGDGTFNLMPIETPCNGTQALRIPIGSEYYYIEYRQPLGLFDSWSGALVMVATEHTGGGGTRPQGPDSWLLDMDPSDDRGWLMTAGQTLTDYQDRVTINLVETNPSHAVVQLTFPNGGSGAPVCADGMAPGTDANGNVGIMDCTGTPPPPPPPEDDVTPPTVAITYPADGAVFNAGDSFTITATAADNIAVQSVTLVVNNADQGAGLTAAPYQWPTNMIPEGTYTIAARATDGPNTTLSVPVTVTVTGTGTTTETTTETTTATTSTTASTSTTATTSTTTASTSTTGTSDSGGTSGGDGTSGTTTFTTGPGFTSTFGTGLDGGEDEDGGGCNCSTSSSRSSSAAALWGLALLGWARRRRRVVH